jgi:two-component system, NtrC family, sensor kinase
VGDAQGVSSESSQPDFPLVPPHLKAALDASSDAAVILDEDRHILYYNRAYRNAAGARGRALLEKGLRCYEVMPLEVCERACIACRARDLSRPIREEMVRALQPSEPGEEPATLAVTAAPLPGGLLVETYRDVTADEQIRRRYKVLLEQERKANEVLEETVRARTAELLAAGEELKRTHAQLIHQEKMSSLGRLVAGIAHELNNPINFVYGNVDFLGRYLDDLLSLVALYDAAEDALAPAQREAVQKRKEEIEFDFLVDDSHKLIKSIRSGAERTANIVRDLKAFSRTSSGEMQVVDLVAGIETTLNLLAPILKNRIKVERTFAADAPKVLCHPGHINQVFMNVLTNAAQAIEGEGSIHVSIRPVQGEDAAEITVRDTGPGIPDAIRGKIFDPFFTTKDVGVGTGLGLAISESIVRTHGGRISCVSEVGKGATFTVVLPVRPPDPAKEA